MHRMTKSHGKKNRSHNTILTKNLQYTCWQVVLTSLRNIALSQLSAASKHKNKCMYTPQVGAIGVLGVVVYLFEVLGLGGWDVVRLHEHERDALDSLVHVDLMLVDVCLSVLASRR